MPYPTPVDYQAQVASLLLAQFRGEPNITMILEGFGLALQDIEAEIESIPYAFLIDLAIGAQLDIWGAFFKVRRNGMSDDDYRGAILAKLAISRHDATPRGVNEVISLACRSVWQRYNEFHPAGFQIDVKAASIPLGTPLALKQASAAGVAVSLVFCPELGDEVSPSAIMTTGAWVPAVGLVSFAGIVPGGASYGAWIPNTSSVVAGGSTGAYLPWRTSP